MKKSIVFFLMLFMIQNNHLYGQMNHDGSTGKLISIPSFKSAFVDARPVTIWLPSDYDSTRKYAVLYMQDGQMLFDSSTNWTHQEWKVDETMSQLLAAQKIKETIVVGINNNGDYRWAEFVPQAILDSFPLEVLDYVMNIWLKGKPQSDAYLRFIVEELKPYIDRTYSTRPDLANTFIMGSSMGGIISLYAICKYPEVFGGAGCLSTHWLLGIPGINDPEWDYDIPAAFRTYLSDHLPSPFNHRIYFDFGSATLDSFYKPHQEKVDALMTMKGFTSADWITLEFPGEEHSERSWAKRLHIPLEFLLGKE